MIKIIIDKLVKKKKKKKKTSTSLSTEKIMFSSNKIVLSEIVALLLTLAFYFSIWIWQAVVESRTYFFPRQLKKSKYLESFDYLLLGICLFAYYHLEIFPSSLLLFKVRVLFSLTCHSWSVLYPHFRDEGIKGGLINLRVLHSLQWQSWAWNLSLSDSGSCAFDSVCAEGSRCDL